MKHASAAARIIPGAELLSEEQYLGPGEVVEAHPDNVRVRLPSSDLEVEARMALAIPYEPKRGDVLLVIGRDRDYYVIGVLAGSGRTLLSFQGDVHLEAVGGELALSGDRGVTVRGPEVSVESERVSMFGDALVQKFASVLQRVTSGFRTHAGEVQTLVDGPSITQANSAAIQTEKSVVINGREIHLG